MPKSISTNLRHPVKTEKERLPLKISYKFDSYLMHLIQEVTKRPAAEILAFFHELSTQVSDIGMEKRTGRGIRKSIVDYFPGSSIPFHLTVKGHKRRSADYDSVKREYVNHHEVFACSAEVGFPESSTWMKEDDLKAISVALMEKALLGGDDVVVEGFKKPEIRTPKMYKPLMDAFSGRPPEEKKEKKKDE
jgi:hypothetical protein